MKFSTSRLQRTMRHLVTVVVTGSALIAHGQASEPAAAGWWTAFNDEALNSLIALPAPASDTETPLARQVAISADYLQARVLTMRLAIAQEAELVALKQAEQRGSGLVAGLAQAWDAHAPLGGRPQPERLAQERDTVLARLATRLGRPGEGPQLGRALHAALLAPTLPLPATLPRDVPGRTLRQRSDVAQAEKALQRASSSPAQAQLHMVQYLQAMASQVEPQRDRPWHLVRLRGWANSGTPVAMLEAARRDVADKLWHVATTAAEADEALDAMRRLKAQRDSLALRVEAGDLAAGAVLADEAALLASEDRLLQKAGAVSQAWIAFQGSVGGAGWIKR